jgi:hypothetical protein
MSEPTLAGFQVVVSPHICDSPMFVRWVKTHKRPRIAKKWHKRFGAVMSRCPGKAFEVGNRLLVCPHVMTELRKTGP